MAREDKLLQALKVKKCVYWKGKNKRRDLQRIALIWQLRLCPPCLPSAAAGAAKGQAGPAGGYPTETPLQFVMEHCNTTTQQQSHHFDCTANSKTCLCTCTDGDLVALCTINNDAILINDFFQSMGQ